MVIEVFPRDIYIVHDWQVKFQILEPCLVNNSKGFFLPFPDFDAENYPFVVTGGNNGIQILNVKNYSIAIFIRMPMQFLRMSNACFWEQRENDYDELHFVRKS